MNVITQGKRIGQYLGSMVSYKVKIADFFDVTLSEVESYYAEILNDSFTRELSERSGVIGGLFSLNMLSVVRAPTFYVVCRILMPEVVVETGVADGFSSSFILQALEKNSRGHLYSIDLPNQAGQELASGRSTGWLVPDVLRRRWTLRIGSSVEILPELAAKLPKIDIFYHDSDHRYDHMMFEFQQMQAQISAGGLLLCDDITENSAFREFCASLCLERIELFKTGIAAIRERQRIKRA
jgi:hypothetical protein